MCKLWDRRCKSASKYRHQLQKFKEIDCTDEDTKARMDAAALSWIIGEIAYLQSAGKMSLPMRRICLLLTRPPRSVVSAIVSTLRATLVNRASAPTDAGKFGAPKAAYSRCALHKRAPPDPVCAALSPNAKTKKCRAGHASCPPDQKSHTMNSPAANAMFPAACNRRTVCAGSSFAACRWPYAAVVRQRRHHRAATIWRFCFQEI